MGKMSRQLSPQSINTVVAFSVLSPEIKQAIESVKYIAENMRSRNKAKEVRSLVLISVLLITFIANESNKINSTYCEEQQLFLYFRSIHGTVMEMQMNVDQWALEALNTQLNTEIQLFFFNGL